MSPLDTTPIPTADDDLPSTTTTGPAGASAPAAAIWPPADHQRPPADFDAALAMIAADPSVPEETRRRWTSSVRRATACVRGKRAKGMPAPPPLPTAAGELARLLERVMPARHCLSQKSWSNIRSDIVAIAMHIGAHAPRAVLRAPLGGPWKQLLDTEEDTPQRSNFLGFARWMAARGIGPGEADDATLADYSAWRRRWTYLLGLPRAILAIRYYWNGRAGTAPGWPERRLAARSRGAPRVLLPLEQFPQSFRDDLSAYLQNLAAPADPFEARSRLRAKGGANLVVGRPLAAGTIVLYRAKLQHAATILAKLRGGPGAVTGLADLAAPDAMKSILTDMYRQAGGRWTPSAGLTATSIISMATRHLSFDDAALAPLRKLSAVVAPSRAGRLSPSARAQVTEMSDLALRRRLLQVPEEMFELAERLRRDGSAVKAARLHEKGLALALLRLIPMRRRNLLMLDIHQDFRRDVAGRVVGLRIDGARVKNGVTIDAEVTPDLARRIERHLSVHRPALPGAATAWLFPARTGDGPCSHEAFAARLRDAVADLIGIKFSIRSMRHLAASICFDADPGNAPLVQRLLGHTSVKTTERAYGELKTAGAQRRYAEILERDADLEARRQRKRRRR